MEHLKKGATGKFTKAIFFFLIRDLYLKAKTITPGPRCNFGDSECLQVPCKLKLLDHRKSTNLLQDELIKMKEIQTKKL